MTHPPDILIIDDEEAFLRVCGSWLTDLGYAVQTTNHPDNIPVPIHHSSFHLVLLDLALPPSQNPEEGLRLIPSFGSTPVIVLTGHADRELAIRAIEFGAWDFLSKPVDPDLLRVVAARALEKRQLEQELEKLRSQFLPENLGLVGQSSAIQSLQDLIRRIAPSDINVMILGPSGTGKELVAKALHRLSPRRDNPFIPIHCGAIPGPLLEAELFGALKGSYTGSDRDRPGMLDAANGGILFLDEIGEMSSSMQVKLLRFLQEGTYLPVGGRAPKHADVRVVCATHRELELMVEEGTFREDLYYRLKGIIFRTPALCDRVEDIPLLTQVFLQQIKRGSVKELSQEAFNWILSQPWPGNVRELQHVIECCIALSGEELIIGLPDVQLAMGIPLPTSLEPPTDPNQLLSLDEQLESLEKHLILQALEKTDHNHSHTAERLKISRSGLLKKMSRLGLR